jgi:hypothetical protein
MATRQKQATPKESPPKKRVRKRAPLGEEKVTMIDKKHGEQRVRYDTVTNDGHKIGRTVVLRTGKTARGGGVVRIGKRTADMLLGRVDFTTWTDEELIAGYQGKNPRVGGATSGIIPLELHQELARRVMTRAQHRFTAELEYAINKLFAIIKEIDPADPSPVQLKALEMVMDRVLGKAVEVIDVRHTEPKPYENLIANAIVADADQLKEAMARQAAAKAEEGKVIDVEPVGEEV